MCVGWPVKPHACLLLRLFPNVTIHALPQPTNNVVACPCTQAWLIDFDHSTESSDPAAQAAELAELRALFRPSDTDASTASSKLRWAPFAF
jgi:hypothetical protein